MEEKNLLPKLQSISFVCDSEYFRDASGFNNATDDDRQHSCVHQNRLEDVSQEHSFHAADC